jgi:dipeptidyl aminopeptidase/acylaminoacyl peptidase
LHVLTVLVALVAIGCGVQRTESPAAPSTSRSPSPEPAAIGRIGLQPLISPSDADVGTIDIEHAADGTISINLVIDDTIQPHPWGIYDQNACEMPSPDHDSPFQFADVEAGRRTEQIEAQGYLGYPSKLVALVMSGNGSALYGCADLGLGVVQASPTGTAACPGELPGSPRPKTDDIAFSRDVLADSEIFVMHADGSGVQRLTSSLGVDMKPTWSPDGQRIAFRTQRDGNDEIYVMDANGGCQRNLTNSPADDRSPAWSPDGRTIAFDHFFSSSIQDIALIEIDGSNLRRVTMASGEYPSWSPDGSQIAFASARTGHYEIYVINRDGTNERRLTHDDAYDMYPSWAPDGSQIAYEHGKNGFDESMEIFTMAADGSDNAQVTRNDVNDRFPAWSPDGRLAWSESGTIMVAASATATPKPIATGQFPAWRP